MDINASIFLFFSFCSIWTVDLAYLLHKFSVNFSFFTVTLGANPSYSAEAFYRVSSWSYHGWNVYFNYLFTPNYLMSFVVSFFLFPTIPITYLFNLIRMLLLFPHLFFYSQLFSYLYVGLLMLRCLATGFPFSCGMIVLASGNS